MIYIILYRILSTQILSIMKKGETIVSDSPL
jgi:hypothetical protein